MNEIVSSWGDNTNGNLGLGDFDGRSVPAALAELGEIRDLRAGSGHVLALLADGTAYAWGRNVFGQTGSGSTDNQTSPVKVRLDGIKAIAPGGGHSLFLREDGTLWGCGAGFFGMLGPDHLQVHPVPVPLGRGPEDIVELISGGSHALALTAGGTVWTWGRDDRGQLGDGAETNTREGCIVQSWAGADFSVRPVPSPVLGLDQVRSVAAGGGHSLAVRTDGTLHAWGFNDCGQLGDGATTDRTAPVQVPGLAGVRQAAGAYHHTLVLLEDGTVRAFGIGIDGQLGDGAVASSSTPVVVPGLTGVRQVAAAGGGNDKAPGGFGHSLALLEDGTVYAWGCNNSGELGLGHTEKQNVPALVPGLTGVRWVTAGGDIPFSRENPGGGSVLAVHTA